MSIRRDKNDPKKWIIDYYPEGRRGARLRLTFRGTEAEACDAEAALRRQHISPLNDRTNPPIRRVWPEYLEHAKLHLAARTVTDILLSWKTIDPIFGPLPVSRITPATITQYQISRAGRSPATINKEINYLKGIIAWMCRNNYAEPLPFRPEMLKYRRPIPQIPHPAEVRAFLDAIPKERLAMVLLLYLSGLRFSEMANLRWEDVNFGGGTVRIFGKGGKWRLADLPKQVADILQERRQDTGLVFPSPKTGRAYVTLRRTFATASKNAGVRLENCCKFKLEH